MEHLDGYETQELMKVCPNRGFCLPVLKDIMNNDISTSSTAQGGGGSFKNRKPIGGIGCCESPMAEQKH